MNLQLPAAILSLAITALLLVAPASNASAVQAAGVPPLPGGVSGSYHSKGPASCNCGAEEDGDEDHQVCITSTAKVTVGSSVFSVETGVAEGTCASKTLSPGECVFYVYNFECEIGFWGTKCVYVSAGTHKKKASTRDCPSIDSL